MGAMQWIWLVGSKYAESKMDLDSQIKIWRVVKFGFTGIDMRGSNVDLARNVALSKIRYHEFVFSCETGVG